MAKKNFFNENIDDNPVMSFLADAEAASLEMEKIKKIKSHDILVSELVQIPELKELFPRDPDVYTRLKGDIERDGLLSPIIIWKAKNIVVDGNTRYDIIKELGWEKIEVKELDFNSIDEAKKFAEIMQLDRRNFTQAQIYEYSNKEIVHQYGDGRDVDIKAEALDVSPSTVKHAQYIERYGDDEQKELILAGKDSINHVWEQVKKAKYVADNATESQKEQLDAGITNVDYLYDEIKRAEQEKKDKTKRRKDIEDYDEPKEYSPAPVTVHQRKEDDSTKFTPPKETEIDEWTKEKNRQVETAKKEGKAEGFEKGFIYVLYEVIKGKSPVEIYNGITDFSVSAICNFELPPDAEDIVGGLNG